MAATAFYAGLRGPDPDYGRRIARLECWGAGGDDEHWRAASPWRQLNLPQIRLEPLMKARAEELSPGRIRFHHELIALEQDDDGVTAHCPRPRLRHASTVRCEYLLGADGGRRSPGLIGVEYDGLGVVDADGDAARLGADFSRWAQDPDVLIRWIFSPQAGVMRGDGADGARALGPGLRGVGDPPQLPRRRPARAVRRAGRGRRAPRARDRRSAR